MNNPKKLPDLLREIVAYARECGHTWSSLDEADSLLSVCDKGGEVVTPQPMTDELVTDFDQWFSDRYPDRDDRQSEFRMTSVRDLMLEAWRIAFGAGCVHGSERARLSAQPAPSGEPVARKLIGWRTENFLWETDDPDKARNWEPNIGVLPIFEGDPNTKLAAPQAPSGLSRPLDPNALDHAINMMPWRDEVLTPDRLRQFAEQLWLQFCCVPAAAPTPAPVQEDVRRDAWAAAANWLRNNYQDHPNIASLCGAMREFGAKETQ